VSQKNQYTEYIVSLDTLYSCKLVISIVVIIVFLYELLHGSKRISSSILFLVAQMMALFEN